MGKISSYTRDSSPTNSDYVISVDSETGNNKRVLFSALKSLFQTNPSFSGTYDGWVADSHTWTYVSGTGTITGVFKITGVDATGYLEPGMRIKCTQSSTVKYGIITKVSFSTDTSVTLLMSATSGTVDNSGLANATISSPAYSRDKIPFGFPIDPARWTVYTASTNDCAKSSPTASAWYGDSGLSSTGPSLAIPIGAWRVFYETTGYGAKTSSTGLTIYLTLSTASNSESDTDFTTFIDHETPTGNPAVATTLHREKYLTLTSATTYYLNIRTTTSSVSSIALRGDITTIYIKAVCAYL